MNDPRDDLTLGRVTDSAVRAATGQGWAEWLAVLDEAGAADWDHPTIVRHLETHHPAVTSWWRQSVTVGYEQARGKRVLGQTPSGFQVGVRRTLPVGPEDAWALLTGRPDLWLGPGARIDFEPCTAYEVPPGEGALAATGEVRVVRPGERLRMTWRPDGWDAPATLQLTLTATGAGRTAVNVHLERLPDARAREAMREHWRDRLEEVRAGLA